MTSPDDPGARYRATLVAFAAQLAGLKRPAPGAEPPPDRLSAAAEMALVVYPGPVGELVAREIRAHLEIGHRFGGDALIHRLITHLMPPPKESTAMAEHDPESLARGSVEAFNRSDWGWVAENCGEPFRYEETGTGRRFSSPGELVAGLQAWKAAIPDGTGEVTRALVAGDTAVLEVVWRGTQTGPMPTGAGVLPPSGRSFEVWATLWVRCRDGKVVQERHHIDLLTMLAQLGALPAPSPA